MCFLYTWSEQVTLSIPWVGKTMSNGLVLRSEKMPKTILFVKLCADGLQVEEEAFKSDYILFQTKKVKAIYRHYNTAEECEESTFLDRNACGKIEKVVEGRLDVQLQQNDSRYGQYSKICCPNQKRRL